jgi:hypothetical protein
MHVHDDHYTMIVKILKKLVKREGEREERGDGERGREREAIL